MKFKKMFTTTDLHVAGEPLRIITSGLPEIPGDTQLEKRAYCMEHLDYVREVLMYEPRGHYDMYGCIITPPTTPGADLGVLFMHNEGWSTMCGHGVIAVVTMAIETGLIETKENEQTLIIDCPCGPVKATAKVNNMEVESVSFENVPSFVYKENYPITVNSQEVAVDIVYGGAFYAVVDADKFNLKVDEKSLNQLKQINMEIRKNIEEQMLVKHPIEDITGIYGTIFSDKPKTHQGTLRNVTVFADQQVDRSPCGSGTAARVAHLYSKGQLEKGELMYHESITDGIFGGEVIQETKIADFTAIIPKVTGCAFITGFHQFVIDPKDPLNKGFLFR